MGENVSQTPLGRAIAVSSAVPTRKLALASIADVVLLCAMGLYILLGVAITPPHGDEYMQIYMAHDVFDLLSGRWDRLTYSPSTKVDAQLYLNLINGTLNKTLIGMMWMLKGHTA